MIIHKEKEHLEQDKSNILLRILSSIFLLPLFIVAIFWLKPLFYILMIVVATGMLNEWYNITHSSIIDLLVGLIVIPISIISLILLFQKSNTWLLVTYIAIICSVDTFAMIGGKTIQGPKLAPKLSPKKTWSGLFIGILSAGFVTYLISKIPNFYIEHDYFSKSIYLFIISCILALTAQLSDLFVSYFKRKFNVKDSGSIIPGHGGILDRFDSIILTSPLLFLIING